MSETFAAFRVRLIGNATHRALIYSPDDIVDAGYGVVARPGSTMYPLAVPVDATLPDALEILARVLRARDSKEPLPSSATWTDRARSLATDVNARAFVDDVFASPDLHCDDLCELQEGNVAHLRELLVLVYEAGARGDTKVNVTKPPRST